MISVRIRMAAVAGIAAVCIGAGSVRGQGANEPVLRKAGGAGASAAAPAPSPVATATDAAAAGAPAQPYEFEADRMESTADGKFLVGIGNVVIKHAGHVLRADYVQVNQQTQDLYARGNISLIRPNGTEWKGNEVQYNIKTGAGEFGPFKVKHDPFYVSAEESESVTKDDVLLKKVTLTTCEGDRPEYRVTATSATLKDQQYLYGRNAVVWLGRVPVFYWPFLRKNLDGTGRWDFMPGYSSRMGAFLLTAYNSHPTDNLKSITRFDVRTKRGVGIGEDLEWKDPVKQSYRGSLRMYYADDGDPYKDSMTEDERDLVDSDRYRVRLSHNQSLGPRDSIFADASYLSDPFVTEDFFRREFKESPQPENRIVYSRRGDDYFASLQANKRLNDFYENVDRVPEAMIDIYRTPIGDSGFYYEGRNAAAGLKRVYPEKDDADEYESARLDSIHQVYYPTRQFGFLALTPRAGYRATAYSETRRSESATNLVTTIQPDGTTNVSESVFERSFDDGAGVRHMVNLGLESSFKMFKVIDDGENALGQGLRHVAEPYADYNWTPEPNLRPDDLYQFDDVDRQDLNHGVRLGTRQKIQTRVGQGAVHDIVDANVYNDFRIETLDGQSNLGALGFDTELRPLRHYSLDFEGSYNWEDDGSQSQGLRDFHAQGYWTGDDQSRIGVEYLYRDSVRNLVGVNGVFRPNQKWSFGTYHRYEFETGRLEEQSYSVQRRLRCIGVGVGFTHEAGYGDDEDDFKVWLQFTILALPGSSIQLGG